MDDLTKYLMEGEEELVFEWQVKSSYLSGKQFENLRLAIGKQLADSAWIFGKDCQEVAEARWGAIELWQALDPEDPIEALLVAQMAGTHNAMMGNLQRAALETLPPDVRERAQNQANKLSDIFARQVAALDRHRGRGRETITVQKVTVVEAGAQAIVGNVEAPALAAPDSPSISRRPPTVAAEPTPARASDVRSRTRRAGS